MADERYNLIGVVRANGAKTTTPKDGGEGKAYAEVQIEDINGMKVVWTTFHMSMAQPLVLGKWYEFEVATPAKKEGSGVWHNLEKVIRAVDKPAAGTKGEEAAVAATGPAHTVKSDAQFRIERTSLQRQGAMGIVLRLMELGVTLPQMEETLVEVLKHAATVEGFYERAIDQPAPAAKAKRERKAPQQGKLATEADAEPLAEVEARTDDAKAAEVEEMGVDHPGPERVPAFANGGELMMKVTSTWRGKSSSDLCELLKVKRPVEITDLDAAWAKAVKEWGEPEEVAA